MYKPLYVYVPVTVHTSVLVVFKQYPRGSLLCCCIIFRVIELGIALNCLSVLDISVTKMFVSNKVHTS